MPPYPNNKTSLTLCANILYTMLIQTFPIEACNSIRVLEYVSLLFDGICLDLSNYILLTFMTSMCPWLHNMLHFIMCIKIKSFRFTIVIYHEPWFIVY